MSDQQSKPVDNRTAAQKISDVELGTAELFNISNHLAKDLGLIKNAIKLLNNKVDAIVKASVAKEEITDAVLDRIMVENNVADLANKVTNMVVNGVVVPEDQVSENSFIVGCEVDDSGKIVNPRIQFALKALQPDLQPKLLGAKPGDSVKFKDGEMAFQLIASYKIQEAPADDSAEAAPAAEAPAAEAAPAEASETPAS